MLPFRRKLSSLCRATTPRFASGSCAASELLCHRAPPSLACTPCVQGVRCFAKWPGVSEEKRMVSPFVVKGSIEALQAEPSSRAHADVLLPDLEDAVAFSMKSVMRQRLKETIETGQLQTLEGQKLAIRVNSLNLFPELAVADLRAIIHPKVNIVMLPKIYCPEDIQQFEKLVTEIEKERQMPIGHTKFLITAETAANYFNIQDVLACSDRIYGGVMGNEDFVAETGGKVNKYNMASKLFASRFVMACHAIGGGCVASPLLAIDDYTSMLLHATHANKVGFTGVFSLTPAQTTITWNCFHRGDRGNAACKELASGSSGAEMIRPSPLPTLSAPTSASYSKLKVGKTIPNEAKVLTVPQNWYIWWSTMLFNSSSFQNGMPHGHGIPHNMLMTLASMYAAIFSKSGETFHGELIGLYDAIQHRNVNVGDMLQIVTEIADVQPVQPSGGSADDSGGAVQAIVTTSHALINQHNDVCFCATLKSRVQNIDDLEADITETGAASQVVVGSDRTARWSSSNIPECLTQAQLAVGDLLIHKHVKSFLASDNTFLINFLGNSWRQDGSIFPPYALCGALSNVNMDIGDSVDERITSCNFYLPILPDHTMLDVSFVKDIQPCTTNTCLEVVEVVTLGLIDVNIADVERTSMPSTLFTDNGDLPMHRMNQIMAAFCPFLYGRVALRAARTITRFRPALVDAHHKAVGERLPGVAKENAWFG
eukprot:scpid15879/ scgid28300/ Citrate lyase subunit beta; Citrate (pro-3S)-lyase subunit beta; Citryl-CoA lyase subunit